MENEEKQIFSKQSAKGQMFVWVLGLLVLGTIVVVALLREKIVSSNESEVSITGRGVVSYQPDIANVTMGVQIDKAAKAEDALNQMNEKTNSIIMELEKLGVSRDKITTQNYSVYPQYEYKDGATNLVGYNANQQLVVKVENALEDKETLGKVISQVTVAGANQINGVNFDVSNLNDLKQQARLAAIEDAKIKAAELVNAAGLKKIKRVLGWYETIVKAPDIEGGVPMFAGLGGSDKEKLTASAPQVSGGTQQIIIDVALNYEVE